jgi:RNA-binding protein YhbY
MIERILKKIIEELGATGVLVIGLCVILYDPLRQMASSLKIINGELGQIVAILKVVAWQR